MAAPLAFQFVWKTQRLVAGISYQALTVTATHWRLYATSCKDLHSDRRPRVAMAPDDSCILCWHPEPGFPYEYSQPIPRNEEESSQGDSPLKVNFLIEEKVKMRPDGPTDNELSNIFFTTKHVWRPKTMMKYKRVKELIDRKAL